MKYQPLSCWDGHGDVSVIQQTSESWEASRVEDNTELGPGVKTQPWCQVTFQHGENFRREAAGGAAGAETSMLLRIGESGPRGQWEDRRCASLLTLSLQPSPLPADKGQEPQIGWKWGMKTKKLSRAIIWTLEGEVLGFHSSCCLCRHDKYSPTFSDFLIPLGLSAQQLAWGEESKI